MAVGPTLSRPNEVFKPRRSNKTAWVREWDPEERAGGVPRPESEATERGQPCAIQDPHECEVRVFPTRSGGLQYILLDRARSHTMRWNTSADNTDTNKVLR